MDCILTGDRIDINDVGDWSVSKTLTGGINAQVQLCSPNGKYSIENIDLRGSFINIKAIVNSTTYEMFTGRIRNVGETYTIEGEEKIDVQCESIMSIAYRRPIIAETLNGTGESIIRYLLDTYGGIDQCWLDTIEDNGTNFTFVNFMENSIIAGVRKICEACRVELFVNREGKLTAQAKKSFSDPVDYTFTQNDIRSMNRTITEQEVPTVCRVRGRYVADTEAGTEDYVALGSYDAVADTATKMVMRIRPLTALSDAMALQGTVNVTAGATQGEVIGFKDGELFIEFLGSFTPGAANTVTFEVTGPNYRVEEFTTAAIRAMGEGLNESIYNRSASGKVFPFSSYDRENADTQMLKLYNEQNTSRIEIVVKSDELISQHGIAYMAVDNIYIQNTVDAALIGERALFEKSAARSRVMIEGYFNPSLLEPNQRVNFPSMYREDDTVEGLLTAISFQYKQSPRSLTASYEISAEVPDYDNIDSSEQSS